MVLIPNNVKFNRSPIVNKTVYANLDKDELHSILDEYASSLHPSVVFHIETSYIFDKIAGKYFTTYCLLVLSCRCQLTIRDIIREFKNLLTCQRPIK